MNVRVVSSTVVAIGVLAATSFAQPQARRPVTDQMQARFHIAVMESVLERAVEHGAQRLGAFVRTAAPDMLLLSGAAQARGFRLEGYGIFFDVQVPALRQSVAWSLRTMLDQNSMALTTAMQQLRQYVDKVPDKAQRQHLEQALKRVELQVGPADTPAVTGETGAARSGGAGRVTATADAGGAPGVVTAAGAQGMAGASAAVPPNGIDDALWANPGEAYTNEVRNALMDAMLDYTGALAVAPDEWLTVAARDNEPRLSQGDLFDVSTVVLRIKGSDLAAFRSERLSRDEARKRIEVRVF